MIVKFFKRGRGGGSGPVNYLTGRTDFQGHERDSLPVILSGDADQTRALIDSLDFTHKYTSGVLSFAPSDTITPEMEQDIMEQFEQASFAGLDHDQYSILWVRHAHAGHHEMHFLVPRVELSTGKSLNIRPPRKAAEDLFDTFRSKVNAEYGLADPDDPTRSRDVSLPDHIATVRAEAVRGGKALKDDIRHAIDAHVRSEIEAGHIQSRDDVVTSLEQAGMEVPRQGKNYITVLDPSSGERIRMKGTSYDTAHFTTSPSAEASIAYGTPDPARAQELQEKLDELVAERAAYHLSRYPVPMSPTPSPDTPGLGISDGGEPVLLETHLEHHLGSDRISLYGEPESDAANDNTDPKQATEQWWHIHRGPGRQPGPSHTPPTLHEVAHDSIGATLIDRVRAVGAALHRAGDLLSAAVERVSTAIGGWLEGLDELTHAGGLLSAASHQLEQTSAGFNHALAGFERTLDLDDAQQLMSQYGTDVDRSPDKDLDLDP